jgi:hypothetical protein
MAEPVRVGDRRCIDDGAPFDAEGTFALILR